MIISDKDASWLAGIIDGEGCIYADKYALRVQVASADPFMAMECQAISKAGSIKETYREGKGYIYIWVCSSRQAGKLLKVILPFLRVKREQAYVAIVLQNLRNKMKTKNYRYRTTFEKNSQEYLISFLKELKRYWRGKKWQPVAQ